MTPANGSLATPAQIALLDRRLFSVHLESRTEGLLAVPQGYEGISAGALFLGHVYPWELLTPLIDAVPRLEDISTAELCADLDRPNPERVVAMVSAGRVAFRALYMHMHWLLEEQRPDNPGDSAFWHATFTEWHRWRVEDNKWLRRRIYKRVDPPLDPSRRAPDPDVHWRWQDFFNGKKRRPDVSWHGSIDVPVHRLLWPVFRRANPLRPDQRLRKRDICDDDFYRDCVNPHHFEYAVPTTDRRALLPGQQFKQRGIFTTYMHKWNVNSVEPRMYLGEMRDVVVCPEGHTMPDGVQKSWTLWSTPGPWYRSNPEATSKCARCYERYVVEQGTRPDGKINVRSRGQRAVNNIAREQQLNDAERGVVDWILNNGGKMTGPGSV